MLDLLGKNELPNCLKTSIDNCELVNIHLNTINKMSLFDSNNSNFSTKDSKDILDNLIKYLPSIESRVDSDKKLLYSMSFIYMKLMYILDDIDKDIFTNICDVLYPVGLICKVIPDKVLKRFLDNKDTYIFHRDDGVDLLLNFLNRDERIQYTRSSVYRYFYLFH